MGVVAKIGIRVSSLMHQDTSAHIVVVQSDALGLINTHCCCQAHCRLSVLTGSYSGLYVPCSREPTYQTNV